MITLKSLINEHARLAFLEKISTILSIFHVINIKFHHTRLLIYLVNKQAGWCFFPPYSFILVCSFIRNFRVIHPCFLKILRTFTTDPDPELNHTFHFRGRKSDHLTVLMAGGIAGIISWMPTYPFDTIKTRMQGDGFGKKQKFKSSLHCFKITISGK